MKSRALEVPRLRDGVSYQGIFVVSFCAFMLIALLALAVTWNWRSWLPVEAGEKSLIHGVRSAVYSFMPYIT